MSAEAPLKTPLGELTALLQYLKLDFRGQLLREGEGKKKRGRKERVPLSVCRCLPPVGSSGTDDDRVLRALV